MVPFPTPMIVAGRNYWTRGQVRAWRAVIAGQAAPTPQPDDEILMNSKQVRALFGGVSDMWLHRRRKAADTTAAEATTA
jgi:hypothetical protein